MLCAVLSLSNLKITLALCLLLNSCKIEYLVLHEILCMSGQPIIFHLIISLFYLLYHNITSWMDPKPPSTFVYFLLFVKWYFIFTLRNRGVAKTWPTGLYAMALVKNMMFTTINQGSIALLLTCGHYSTVKVSGKNGM